MNDFSMTTIQEAQANTLNAVKQQVVDFNKVLKDNYLTAFNNWSQNVTAGRPANGEAPKPPNAFVVGYFTDPTTGPGSGGAYGDTPFQWAYPATGKEPVCPMPPMPVVTPQSGPTQPGDSKIGDAMNNIVGAPDELHIGSAVWNRVHIGTPWGMAVFYRRVA